MNYWFHKGDKVRLTTQAGEEASVDVSRVWEIIGVSEEEGAKDNANLAYRCRSGTWEAWWLDRELVRAD